MQDQVVIFRTIHFDIYMPLTDMVCNHRIIDDKTFLMIDNNLGIYNMIMHSRYPETELERRMNNVTGR